MQKQLVGLASIIIITGFFSCKPKGFTKLKSGLEYQIVKDEKGDKKAVEGSMIKLHIQTLVGDSVIFDSRKQNGNEPIQAQVTKPAMAGDVMEGFPLLTAGDSAVFRVAADSVFKDSTQKPPFVKKGDMMGFRVKLVSVSSKEEFEQEQKKASVEQDTKDAKIIDEFVAKNGLATQKTASGIHYIIEKPGSAKHPTSANTVKVHYKGTLLDGTKFDSSYDRKQPAEFPLTGVIKGWTEGIPLFGEGGKGKLIIPSSLAYGPNAQPGSPIKPNSVLIFDVELLQIVK
jgi:FKBP-type peptidyl-prolyl cis-trans isomerase FkpA